MYFVSYVADGRVCDRKGVDVLFYITGSLNKIQDRHVTGAKMGFSCINLENVRLAII